MKCIAANYKLHPFGFDVQLIHSRNKKFRDLYQPTKPSIEQWNGSCTVPTCSALAFSSIWSCHCISCFAKSAFKLLYINLSPSRLFQDLLYLFWCRVCRRMLWCFKYQGSTKYCTLVPQKLLAIVAQFYNNSLLINYIGIRESGIKMFELKVLECFL